MENKKLTADVLATKLAQVIHQMGKDECHLSKLIKYFPLDKYYVNGYMDDDLMNALIEVFDKEGIMLINDVNGSQTIFFPTKLINEEDSEEIDNGYEDKDLEKLAGIKTNDEYEEVIPCKLCGDTNPTYEMVKEKDLGWICDRCARSLESRGEELDFDDDPDGFYGINESVIHKPRLYSKTLAKVVDMCWSGSGKYAKYGKWSIGLGGYDLGYEVSYLVNGRFRGLFAIHPDNKVEMYQDEEDTKALCGLNFEQIITSLQQVDRNITLGVDGEDF